MEMDIDDAREKLLDWAEYDCDSYSDAVKSLLQFHEHVGSLDDETDEFLERKILECLKYYEENFVKVEKPQTHTYMSVYLERK